MKHSDWIDEDIKSYRNNDEKWIRDLWEFVEAFHLKHFEKNHELLNTNIDNKNLVLLNAFEFVFTKIQLEKNALIFGDNIWSVISLQNRRNEPINYDQAEHLLSRYYITYMKLMSELYFVSSENFKNTFNIADLKGQIKTFNKVLDEHKSEELNKDRELENAFNIIKKLKMRSTNKIDNDTVPNLIKKYRKGLLPHDRVDDVKKYLYANCKIALKKNGLINFNGLGRLLGISNKTARDWCTLFGIKASSLKQHI